MTNYAEFAATSNFSFLWGASHPEELIAQAARLQYFGFGLADRNSVAGVVRAHLAKRETELALRYHPGARLSFRDGTPDILAYPRDRAGWAKLCRLLTRGNLRAEKGDCILHLDDLLEHAEGLELIVMENTSRGIQGAEHNTDYQLTPVTSPLVGEVGSRARASREGGISPAESDKHPPPHPSPTSKSDVSDLDQSSTAELGNTRVRLGEGTDWDSPSARSHNQAGKPSKTLARLREAAPGSVRLAASMLYRGTDRARRACR